MVCITRHLQPIPFDPDKDIVPVSRMTTSWGAFAVHPSVPANTVAEFVAYAKANPGKINYGSAGLATITHLFGEMLCLEAGIKMTHVPYRGSAPAVQDLLGGRVAAMMLPLHTAMPLAAEGRIRMLAIGSPARSPAAPALPTMAEAGYPGVRVGLWYGLFAPAGLPPALTERLNDALRAWLTEAGTAERLRALGMMPAAETAAPAFAALVARDAERWARVIEAAGITAD